MIWQVEVAGRYGDGECSRIFEVEADDQRAAVDAAEEMWMEWVNDPTARVVAADVTQAPIDLD